MTGPGGLLCGQIFVHAFLAALAAEAAFAEAAEAARRIEHVGAVDPHHAGLQLRRDVHREVDVLAPHRSRQPVTRVVGKLDGLFRRTEAHRGKHRAENFLLRQYVGGSHAGGERRKMEPAGRGQLEVGLPAGGALPGALGDQTLHPLELAAVDQRADVGVLVERAADAQPRHPRLHLGDEGIGDAFLDEQPRSGAADLALVEPDPVDQSFHRAVEVGILEDEEGGLAAELQRELLAGTRRRPADDLAHLGRAREGDLVHAGMVDDRGAGARAARNDVDDALRHAGPLADLGKQKRGERRELRRLQHHRAAGGERRSDLPGEHQQRKVPRDDLAGHADRPGFGKLPVQRLRPAGMVQEMADGKRHVDVAAFADRLAVVERLQDREQPLMPLHGAADRIEDPGTLVAGPRAPSRQRLRRRLDRRIDIGVPGFRHAWPAFRRWQGRWCRRSRRRSPRPIRRR